MDMSKEIQMDKRVCSMPPTGDRDVAMAIMAPDTIGRKQAAAASDGGISACLTGREVSAADGSLHAVAGEPVLFTPCNANPVLQAGFFLIQG